MFSVRRECLMPAFVALAVIAPESSAQDRQDITGVWVLSIDDSQFGMMRPPSSEELDLTRADEQLVMTSIREFGMGTTRESTVDIPADGKEHSIETEHGSGMASAEWVNGQLVVWRLTEATVRTGGDASQVEIELTDSYSLRDSGQLEISRSIAMEGRSPMQQTLVYIREGS